MAITEPRCEFLGPWDTARELSGYLQDGHTLNPDLPEMTLDQFIAAYREIDPFNRGRIDMPPFVQVYTGRIDMLRGPDLYFKVRDSYADILMRKIYLPVDDSSEIEVSLLTPEAQLKTDRRLFTFYAMLHGVAILVQDPQIFFYRLNLDLLKYTMVKYHGKPCGDVPKEIFGQKFVFPDQKGWGKYTMTTDDTARYIIETMADDLFMWPGAVGMIAMWASLETSGIEYYRKPLADDLAAFREYVGKKNSVVNKNLAKYPDLREIYIELLNKKKGK